MFWTKKLYVKIIFKEETGISDYSIDLIAEYLDNLVKSHFPYRTMIKLSL